jgi:hypothetical protein
VHAEVGGAYESVANESVGLIGGMKWAGCDGTAVQPNKLLIFGLHSVGVACVDECTT